MVEGGSQCVMWLKGYIMNRRDSDEEGGGGEGQYISGVDVCGVRRAVLFFFNNATMIWRSHWDIDLRQENEEEEKFLFFFGFVEVEERSQWDLSGVHFYITFLSYVLLWEVRDYGCRLRCGGCAYLRCVVLLVGAGEQNRRHLLVSGSIFYFLFSFLYQKIKSYSIILLYKYCVLEDQK